MLVICYAGFGALGVTTHISIVANKVLLDAAVVGSGRVILGRARVLVLWRYHAQRDVVCKTGSCTRRTKLKGASRELASPYTDSVLSFPFSPLTKM